MERMGARADCPSQWVRAGPGEPPLVKSVQVGKVSPLREENLDARREERGGMANRRRGYLI